MKKRENMPIYMDYQATTPVDDQVIAEMVPYMSEFFGNSGSKTHAYGWEAEKAVEKARKKIASLINADSKDVIFTSGATESNNIALKGVMDFYKNKGNHLITVKTEHKCVIETANFLKKNGFEVTFLDVNSKGRISLNQLKKSIRKDTILVSVMAANNETGTIQDLESIGQICKKAGVFFHTDAAQAFGKINLDVDKLNIDLMSISAHKIYGPKGIGALYVRRKPRVRITPLIHGGGQERGMRSWTLPVPLIVGFGKAAELAEKEIEQENNRLQKLKNYFYKSLKDNLEEVYLNGSMENSLSNCINLSFAFIEGESLVMALKNLAVSTGSACTSASLQGSYVLKAMGSSEEMAHSSIRFGFGRFTTKEEVDDAIRTIIEKVNKLRKLSPLWDMFKDGVDFSSVKWDDSHGGH